MLEWYSRVASRLQFALKLQEMREMIEPYAAASGGGLEHATTRSARSPRRIAAMVAARNVDEWVRADLRFHLSVLTACSNELLIPLGTLIERTLEAQLRLNAKRARCVQCVAGRAYGGVRCDRRARRGGGARARWRGLLGVTRERIEA